MTGEGVGGAAGSRLAPALTILLSSFLLFLVQPIIARQILPWFGGSASVWTICLVFFQLLLLLGYSYAHWLTRRGTSARQFLWHGALLLLSCLALPIIAGPSWKPVHDSQPALQILGLLAATVGLPYFLLASTAPLLQKWLSEATGGAGHRHSIYRLFALSNLGSLAGLLSYPFAIEPFTTLRVQAWVWSVAYLLYVGSLASYIWTRRLAREPRLGQNADHPAAVASPSTGLYAYWIACAALGSALLLSVTNQITQNVASIPLLWIVPLSIYLLSFVLCFEGRSGRGWYERRFWMTPALLATAAMAWALSANQANLSIYLALPLYATGLLLGCMVCHGELARSKPSPVYLTHFYLSLAAGGAVGGLLVGLLAPLVFDSYWELPLALLALAALGVHGWSQELRSLPKVTWIANVLIALPAAALVLLLLRAVPAAFAPHIPEWGQYASGDVRWGCTALLLMAVTVLQRYDLSRAVALTALLCTLMLDWGYHHSLSTGTELMVRNFYGALRVQASTAGALHIRTLAHGVTVHGSQVLEAPQSEMPTTYYGESSGIGRTLLIKHMSGVPLRIGSIGLGAGTLAVYGQTGDVFRAYELNPTVVDIAHSQFSYLRDSKAKVEIVIGDARLSLERELAQGKFDRPEQRYDVLSVDAFSGDAIPVHLLTREAFASYARAITQEGVIAFHISNRYLDLAPVLEQNAHDAGFQAVLVADRPSDIGLLTSSDWVLVTRSTEFLRQPEIAAYSTPIVPRRGLREWTDQFSNLFQILK
jgi:hypothetical protein